MDVSSSTAAFLESVEVMTYSEAVQKYGHQLEDYAFDDGLVSYKIGGIAPGESVTVRLTFPSPPVDDMICFKLDSEGFSEVMDAAFTGNEVLITLVDGGAGDADGEANGVIVDPVGIGVPVEELPDGPSPSPDPPDDPPETVSEDDDGDGGGGGGCFITVID